MKMPEGLAEALLDSASDAIVATDRDGRITFWNPGAARIFGFAPGEALGQSLDLIIPENLRARHWAGFRHVMQTGTSRYGQGELLSVPALTKDGRRVSVEFTIVMLRGREQRVAGTIAVMRDVTRRFEEVKELKRRLGEVADQAGKLARERRGQINNPPDVVLRSARSTGSTGDHAEQREQQMQYLLMIYRNEAELGKMDPAARQKMSSEYGAFTQSIIQSGNFKAGDALQPSTTATTVRVRDGKILTTDGPFAETREQLGGYYLVEAKDLDAAIGIAARIPGAREGSIEVRPIMIYK